MGGNQMSIPSHICKLHMLISCFITARGAPWHPNSVFWILSWLSAATVWVFFLQLWPWRMNQSINTQIWRMDGILSLRINLPQIRYSNGSVLLINSCIYWDYFGNLLAFTLESCNGSLLHPRLLCSINLIWAQRPFSLFLNMQRFL